MAAAKQFDHNSGMLLEAPWIIAIETSGTHGSVAVAEGGELRAEAPLSNTTRHATDLLPTMDCLCRTCGWRPGALQHCYLSIGPGSFTGLRVAVTVGRHLALAAGARLVAVPTLAVIAEEARPAVPRDAHLAVMLDARRGHVFGAVFRNDVSGMTALRPVEMIEPGTLLKSAPRPCWVTGEGAVAHQDAIDQSRLPLIDEPLRRPRARSVHRLGWRLAQDGCFVDPSTLIPHYVRKPEPVEILERAPRQEHR